jgi:hypothetical protein
LTVGLDLSNPHHMRCTATGAGNFISVAGHKIESRAADIRSRAKTLSSTCLRQVRPPSTELQQGRREFPRTFDAHSTLQAEILLKGHGARLAPEPGPLRE